MPTLMAVALCSAAALHPAGLAPNRVSAAASSETARFRGITCSATNQRRTFLLAATAALTAGTATLPASAADKGKAYNDCISKCVYEQTKIAKGIAQVEVKPREDAMAECKPKCLPLAVKK
jgi:hypothetical protein